MIVRRLMSYAIKAPATSANTIPRPAAIFPLTFNDEAAPVLLLFPFAFPPIALLTPADEVVPVERVLLILVVDEAADVGSAEVIASVVESLSAEVAEVLLLLDGTEDGEDEPEPVLELLLPPPVVLLLLPPLDVPSPPETILPVPQGIASPLGCVALGGSTCEFIEEGK